MMQNQFFFFFDVSLLLHWNFFSSAPLRKEAVYVGIYKRVYRIFTNMEAIHQLNIQ